VQNRSSPGGPPCSGWRRYPPFLAETEPAMPVMDAGPQPAVKAFPRQTGCGLDWFSMVPPQPMRANAGLGGPRTGKPDAGLVPRALVMAYGPVRPRRRPPTRCVEKSGPGS